MDDGFTLLDRAEPVDVSSAPAATLAEEEASTGSARSSREAVIH